MLGVPVGNDVVEDDGQWKLVCRRKNKTSFKTFQKIKDKAQSSFGTFGIPFGVSGPRPLQEAKVFSARTVSARFFNQFASPGKYAFNAGMLQRLPRETEMKRSVSERAGITALRSAVKSRPPCSDETDLKNLVSKRAGFSVLEDLVKSRPLRAGETALKNLVSKRAVASRWVRATASENEGIIGLRSVLKSRYDSVFSPSINSSMGV